MILVVTLLMGFWMFHVQVDAFKLDSENGPSLTPVGQKNKRLGHYAAT
jgi:hypothetical protein